MRRVGAGVRAGRARVRMSAVMICRRGPKRWRSWAAQSRSISMAVRRAPLSNRGAVRAPSPGPISRRVSAGVGLMASMIRWMTVRSRRKCWP